MYVHQKSFETPGPSLVSLIAAHAARRPEALALICGGQSLSRSGLEARAAGLAAALASAGVARGDLVAVCLPRGIEQVAALYGIWRAGAAYLPLDPEWPDARLARLVDASGCRLVLGGAGVAELCGGAVPVLDPASVAPAEVGQPVLDPAPDDLAYVIYTSGSTGEPKGVEVTHGNVAALVAWHVGAFGLGEGTRTGHEAGLAFDASAWEVWPTLAAGGTLVIVDDETVRLDPTRLRDWIVRERLEVVFAPTALAEPLVAMDWPSDSALRLLLTGADKLKARPGSGLPFVLVNNYGPTECTVVATSGPVSAEGVGLPSIGKPIAGTTVHLLDAEGKPVAPGVEGEIWIGGAQVARGYRGDAALTAERFVEHAEHGRLYRTGDLGLWLADGDLAFRGRVDGQVKVRGHRIEPAEVEAALVRVPGIAAAAVTLREDELVAFVVPSDDRQRVASQIREELAQSLPAPMLPARFGVVAALPLNSSGKVDLAMLPGLASCALPETLSARAPATPTEERLLAIIQEVIGHQDVGVEDDFFLLGGHSLLGTQVIVRAQDAFGVELTLFHLFEGRTVAALSARIEELVMERLASLSDEDLARLMAEG